MNANEEPKNAGTLPLARIWKSSVPRPANNSVSLTERPVSTGTKMVAPEHREHVLDAQHKHARLAKGGRVVNGGWGFGLRSGAGGIAHGLPFWKISNRLMIRLRGAARLLKYGFSRANSAWGYSQPFHISG